MAYWLLILLCFKYAEKGGKRKCPLKTQGTKPTLYFAEAALWRVSIIFYKWGYDAIENFKLYLMHPVNLFFIRYISGWYPL